MGKKQKQEILESTDESKSGVMSRRAMLALTAGIGLTSFALSKVARAENKCVEDTLDRIKRTGVFNLGAREATPPYGYKDAKGNYVGFSTEIAQAMHANIEKELKTSIKLKYIPVTSSTRIPLLQNETIDMEAGATVITQPRVKVVDFSVPNFLTSTEVIVAASSPIQKLQDLAGKRLGVPQGGLEASLYRSINGSGRLSSPVEVVGFPDHPQGFTALQTGSIDAYSSDGPILYGMRSKAADASKWRVFDPGLNVFLQAFPIRPESSKFKTVIDLTIVKMFATGEWDKLFEKYFGPAGVAPFEKTDALKALVVMNSWPA